jgi:hypothetical protein
MDLSRVGCFEAFPWFSNGWRIAGSPVVIDVPQPPPLREPPPLLPKVAEILNLQPRGSIAKPYQVKQVRAVIVRSKLAKGIE